MNFSADGVLSMAKQGTAQGGNTMLGLVGAAAGALVMGIIYGVVGRVAFEHSAIAILVGVASGFAALKLGGKKNLVIGLAAAAFTLVGSLVGKIIIGSPPGVSWIAYHTTFFDIIFCYVAAPLAAVALAGTDKLDGLRRRLPF